MSQKLFFLHIKKSAGTSVKMMLGEQYPIPNFELPQTFIQVDPKFYNYYLNSHHLKLGEYNFKRALFAKNFLYKDFSSLYSFAFSRNPTDRFLSMFYYLYYKNNLKGYFLRNMKSLLFYKKISFNIKDEFDIFLNYVHDIHVDKIIEYPNFSPFDQHFATHTAPMYSDICENENILLTKIFKLDDFKEAMDEVFESCNIEHPPPQNFKKNVNTNYSIYKPNSSQIKKIETIYRKDFDLYYSI